MISARLRRVPIAVAILLVGSCAVPHTGSDADPFRVISYNILVGFGNHRVGDPFHPGATRKRNVRRFLVSERPDVVAFQEMNGYTRDRLRREAKAWGHSHAVMLKERGYPTAVTSRYPIQVIERKLAGMHHGLMRVRTGGIDFVVVHLWPFKGAARMREVRAALSMYANAREARRPCIMLGDFNAVAASDVPTYSDGARSRYAKWKWETHDDGRPRTDVMDACLAAGLIDVCRRHGALPRSMHEPRIDFILGSPDLAARGRGARWLANPALLKNSDHPAVVAEFDWHPADR